MLSAAPAPAANASFTDAPNDVAAIPYLDLKAVSVKNTKKSIRVTYSSKSLGNLNGVETLLLDTNPKKKGPELQVGFGRYSEGWVTPMKGWKADRSKAAKRKWNPNIYGKPGTCDRTVRINSRWEKGFTPVTITVRKKKGCITTKRVRVQVLTSTEGYSDLRRYDRFGSVLRDRLPNGSKTSFTGWVKQRSTKAKATRFVDGRDTITWWSDIRSVAVTHTTERLTVTVRHLARPVYRHGVVKVHLDTNDDRVPDYVVELGTGNPVLRAATGWGQYGPKLVCSIDGGLAPTGLTTSTFWMPTAPCLHDPTSVRVAVSSEDRTTSNYTPTDWLGGTRVWSAPVARG